ncbi:hypothetical protein [Bacillus sp. EB600]|uniref:hypothetical protein n=1 Tax=Bacillus sp. EB600 TaxID=2806345 RepID=UPI00210B14BB|nr:hypothetical protein [Bacillus sp. EB600]MCQ6278609.1 hypothetical protein [Bacillus sp. EB600]
MNARVKLGIFWGAIVVLIIGGINFFRHLLGGHRHFKGGPNGFRSGRMMGQPGGFGPRAYMNGPHHGGEFHVIGFLLFLIIAAAVVVLVVRWLRKRAKASLIQQLIETPVVGSHITVSNQNASILDQWEKNLTDKKEIE